MRQYTEPYIWVGRKLVRSRAGQALILVSLLGLLVDILSGSGRGGFIWAWALVYCLIRFHA
jgi:hypothetical protein